MSSSSKSASSNRSSTRNVDRRMGVDGGSVVATDNARINMTDGGAFKLVGRVADEVVNAASDVANIGKTVAIDSLGFARSVADDQAQIVDAIANASLAHAERASDKAQGIVEQALSQSQEDTAELMKQFINIAIPAAALVLIFWSYR